jgi:hypothetical protein
VELRICLLRSYHVILDDMRALNKKDKGRDALDSPKHDQLRVELVAPMAPSLQAFKKPDFLVAELPRALRKRKQNIVDQSAVTASRSRAAEESDS